MSEEEQLSQILEMQKLYTDTEKQLLEFIDIIPIDNTLDVYSPRLYSLLQFSCAQVDSLFKTICQYLNITVAKQKFPEFYKSLNVKGMLEKQEVFVFIRNELIHPFSKTDNHLWWTAYNDTKHQLPDGIRQGTLRNVLHAMTASYVLNNIVYLTATYAKDADHILDAMNWKNKGWIDYSFQNIMIMKSSGSYFPKSEFFYLNSSYSARRTD